MPSLLADFTRAKLHEPQLIRLDLETKLSDALEILFFKVRPKEKLGALLLVLGSILQKQQQTIVFASTRHHVELLHELLTHCHFASAAIYGTLDPAARKIALGKFRAGKAKVRPPPPHVTTTTHPRDHCDVPSTAPPVRMGPVWQLAHPHLPDTATRPPTLARYGRCSS